jgi:hypothetical protein
VTARAPLLAAAALLGCVGWVGCGGPGGSPPPEAPVEPGAPPSAQAAPAFATGEAAWGRFHSKRFQLSVPLPDGRGWKIDDRSRPELFATHPETSSALTIALRHEDELMNRHKCEARARARGEVPSAPLTTIEDHAATGPDAYDTRTWVALDAGRPGEPIEGHVFLFGGFLRRCLFVHFSTRVPSMKDDDALSSRLAIASERIVRGIAFDPPRTTDDAEIPRDRPGGRR